jgi:hypothetical protein
MGVEDVIWGKLLVHPDFKLAADGCGGAVAKHMDTQAYYYEAEFEKGINANIIRHFIFKSMLGLNGQISLDLAEYMAYHE